MGPWDWGVSHGCARLPHKIKITSYFLLKTKMERDNKISFSKAHDYVVRLDFPTSLLLSTLASDVLNSGLFGK